MADGIGAIVGHASRRPPRTIAVLSSLLAVLAAVASIYRVDLLPPRLEAKKVGGGAATAHALVAGSHTEVGGGLPEVAGIIDTNEVNALVDRATLVANVMASRPVRRRLGALVGVAPARISAQADITQSVRRSLVEPSFERRANQLLVAGDHYQLDIQPRPDRPIIDIYAQAPSAAQARRLADASVAATDAFLADLARDRGVEPGDRINITQLGRARGGVLDPTAPLKVAGLTFVVVFVLVSGLLVLITRLRAGWQAARAAGSRATPAGPSIGPEPEPGGTWPRTTRLLPWLLAVFIALIWLVPFNAIALDTPLPIDLKLDRLVLPAIVLLWALALFVGGPGAPRSRFGPLHAAVAVFAGVACLSVVLNADYLNQTLGLDLAIKKLALLSSYVALFIVVAGTVRKSEVRPFLKYTLALAMVCAVGVLWEYRFGSNVFYEVSTKLFSGVLNVDPPPSGFDDLGRRSVSGPTDHGLEVVAILSMALPIALVGIIKAERLRGRVLYGLAACLVGVAAISTYRKSAFVAPLSVLLTLAFFNPRGIRKLAPLAVIALIALPIVSFSAFGSVTGQFGSDRLQVPTVGDRVSDYDAIRPEVLTRPAFGRGFGSYENTSDPAGARILDSDLLLRLVESGILGLAAFIAMIVAVIALAAPIIRAGDRRRAPPALAIASAASAFLVLSVLFDEWSFPHAPYMFLTLAGMLAVILHTEPPVAETVPQIEIEPIEAPPERTGAPA